MVSPSPGTIFVTGASGFIGRHVLRRLADDPSRKLICLARSRDGVSIRGPNASNIEWIEGDLELPETYREALTDSSVAIHLAGATGAASADRLRAVNELGTALLCGACKEARISKFLFMSSIAVKGENLAEYPYAQSKLAAEHIVQESGLRHVILRPTIVLGPDAPNWIMLRKLACLPIVPLVGGGVAGVQPIDVLDVARAIELLVDHDIEINTVTELGGLEILSFASFLQRIRRACGRSSFPSVSLPIGPIRAALRMIKLVLGARAPVGPGQLAPFVNDGIAEPNMVYEQLQPNMHTLDELLQRLVHEDP